MFKNDWLAKCTYWKNKWPLYLEEFENEDSGLNLYKVIEFINNYSLENDVFIVDAGSANYVGSQNIKIKENQFFLNPGSQGDMGFALPASIGIGLADNKYNPIVITGDGSFNTNLQELATIKANKIKTKLFILDNDGYLSIRNTQINYFNNNVYGESVKTGLFFPDIEKLASAYELKYFYIDNSEKLSNLVFDNLHSDESIIFHVKCKHLQEIVPNLTFKTDKDGNKIQCGLEDMYPFLDETELKNESII